MCVVHACVHAQWHLKNREYLPQTKSRREASCLLKESKRRENIPSPPCLQGPGGTSSSSTTADCSPAFFPPHVLTRTLCFRAIINSIKFCLEWRITCQLSDRFQEKNQSNSLNQFTLLARWLSSWLAGRLVGWLVG